jgi:hypothetical protein
MIVLSWGGHGLVSIQLFFLGLTAKLRTRTRVSSSEILF